MRVCEINGCDRRHVARGFCQEHWRDWRAQRPFRSQDQILRHGRTLKDRFWSFVSPCPITGCWWWTGTVAGLMEYGTIRIGGKRGRMEKAHRLSFEWFVGPIPSGLHVLHRCDQPSCVNPDHLFVGTQLDNARDMALKGRAGGLKLSELDVIAIRNLRGIQSGVMVAKMFGVARSTVCKIQKGLSRRHVSSAAA